MENSCEEVSARVFGGGSVLHGGRWVPLRVLGKADLGGRFWPNLDPMDSACLRTASMEWHVPGKYGPPATVPVSGTFSPFFNADIRTPLFSAVVLKKCAFIALHVTAEEGRDGDGFHVPVLAQSVQCGRVKAMLHRKTKVCPLAALVEAMCATMRCTSSGCVGLVTRSLFSCRIGSWQSCHMALDMLCQEINGPW